MEAKDPLIPLIALSANDVPRIAELERRCFIPPLQADAETLAERFRRGHRMFGIEKDAELVALVASYARTGSPNLVDLPATEKEFCLWPHQAEGDTLVIYNLEVLPSRRGRDYARQLLEHAMSAARSSGLRRVIGNARMPSYNGSCRYPQEKVIQNEEFRAAIDQYLRGGPFPTTEQFLLDSTLRLYHELTECEFARIAISFAVGDVASGGMRALVVRDLANGPPP